MLKEWNMRAKIMPVLLTTLLLIIATGGGSASAYGYNFTFPFARRSDFTNSYNNPPGHLAYDYLLYAHEPVAAARGGTVSASEWDFQDGWHHCDGIINDRGNYITLDH
jgi:hypothetical protein